LDDTDSVQKRQPIRILIGPQSGFVHQGANRKVRHQKTVELLPYQVRRLAA
jgi:hypothetical protein